MFQASDTEARALLRETEEKEGGVTTLGPMGSTLLHRAASTGDFKTIEFLLDPSRCGVHVDVNLHDSEGYTVLDAAVSYGHEDVVNRLLAVPGIDVNVHTQDQRGPGGTSNNATPLHCAAEECRPEIALDLLAAGANPNALNRMGQTPLHTACRSRNTEVAIVLLQRGATEMDQQDFEGLTPLHVAAQMGHHNTVDLLLTAGADGDALDDQNNSALAAACQEGHVAVVRSLLEYGVHKNSQNSTSGWSALHIACYQGNLACVRLLLEHKVDVALRDHEGLTAGQGALVCHQSSIVAAIEEATSQPVLAPTRVQPEIETQRHERSLGAGSSGRAPPIALHATSSRQETKPLPIFKILLFVAFLFASHFVSTLLPSVGRK